MPNCEIENCTAAAWTSYFYAEDRDMTTCAKHGVVAAILLQGYNPTKHSWIGLKDSANKAGIPLTQTQAKAAINQALLSTGKPGLNWSHI